LEAEDAHLVQVIGAGDSQEGRSDAMVQRMERKKNRERMRRIEVNDKFNELMEVRSTTGLFGMR
jgi:hypothetical protein